MREEKSNKKLNNYLKVYKKIAKSLRLYQVLCAWDIAILIDIKLSHFDKVFYDILVLH